MEVFNFETQNAFVAVCAYKSRKGRSYFKVIKSFKESFKTEESINYSSLEDAIATYISWCK